jgi:Holliday junction resolvase
VMSKEWNSSQLVAYLTAAGAKGRTRSALEKKIPKQIQNRNASILSDLRLAGVVRGPFKNRSDYYFAPQFSPRCEEAEALIEDVLREAGARLTTRSALKKKVTGFLKTFFDDALASLKAEAKIVELKDGRNTKLYVHREAVLEQLRLADESGPSAEPSIQPSRPGAVTLENIRPIYEKLKAEQGGISTVKIYDIMTRLGAAKEDLHRLLLHEAKSGRLSLHRASTAKFPPEVIAAGIRLEGQPEPLVTLVLKEEP